MLINGEMDKIIYKTITINDNMMLVVQALIDKQDEIIDAINSLQKLTEKSNLFEETNNG